MSAVVSSGANQPSEENLGSPSPPNEVHPVRTPLPAQVDGELILAPGIAPSPALEASIDLLMLSVDDAVRLLEAAAKGAKIPIRCTVEWSNGSRRGLANPEQLREIAELGMVQILSGVARYPDGTGLTLDVVQGEVSLYTADVQSDSISRKRFHEIKNFVDSLSAPKTRLTSSSWLSFWQSVGALGVIVIGWSLFRLPSLLAFASLLIGLALAVPFAASFVTALKERRTRSHWLVMNYPQPRRLPWWEILSILLTSVGLAIAVLAWLFPR